MGPADLGLERLGRALGDQLAPGDDPDAVGELVGLLQVLGGEEDGGALLVQLLDLLPDRLAADRVEARWSARPGTAPRARAPAPRPGPGGAACRPSRCRRGGRRPGSARPGGAASRRARRPRSRGSPCSVACRWISSRPVISGSSAASCSATPILRRTAPGSSATLKPGDRGPAAGGLQQRGQHPHRGRLAGAVRAQEAVDLAVGDLEVHPVDGLDPALELACELVGLDRGHARTVSGDARRATPAPRSVSDLADPVFGSEIATIAREECSMTSWARTLTHRTPASPRRRARGRRARGRGRARRRHRRGRGGPEDDRARRRRAGDAVVPGLLPGDRQDHRLPDHDRQDQEPVRRALHGQDRRLVDQALAPEHQADRVLRGLLRGRGPGARSRC